MDIDSVLNEELERIRPSSDKISHLNSVADNFVSKLREIGLEAHLGGSLAKGTLVNGKDKDDLDIFVVFNSEDEIESLEGNLGDGLGFGELRKVHGSRDYFQIEGEDYLIEVIPVVKNTNPKDALNVTDVSLKHVEFVSSKISENSTLADEIRLAKAFSRANKVYGAESYIHGFSGYSLEVLVIHFGSFVGLLKSVKGLTYVDSEKQFKGEKEARREINSSKLEGPLLVVDPTYKYRNVSAGLSIDTFEKFVSLAGEFLDNPSREFFVLKELDLGEMESFANSEGARLLKIELSTDRQEGDIAGTKMRKFLDFVVSEFKRKGQVVLRVEFEYGGSGQNSFGYVVVKENKEVEVKGPSLEDGRGVEEFKSAHPDFYEKEGILYFKENVSVEEIVNRSSEKVGAEMGARGNIIL